MGTDNERKQHFLQHSNNKEAYTDGSKNTERAVGFAAVFLDITSKRLLPEETTIPTAEMTAMREIQKKRG